MQPSHVDLRTQIGWQCMDGDFVGVIVSAFNRELSKWRYFTKNHVLNYPLFNRKKDGSGVNAHSVEIAAFQAKNSARGGGHDRIDVPIEIVPMTEPGTPYQELENSSNIQF